MSKIDQIHLRAVILCMSKMSKMGKEHAHTFLLITFLIFNRFSIRMLHTACSVQNNVEDVEDIKTSHNRFLKDFLKFISLLLETSKMCMNHNIDSNMKSSNYSKI